MKNLAALGTALFLPVLMHAQSYSASRTFGNAGAVYADVANGGENANTHILLPDGKLLLAGFGYDISINGYFAALMRIDTICGAPDTTFGTGGLASVTFEQRTKAIGYAIQPDGKIVGCGMIAPSNAGSQQWPGVFRLNSDGTIDTTFNGTGYNRFAFNGGSGDLTACFVNPDGTITCTGAGFSAGIGAFRFMPDGTVDNTFGTGGAAVLALPSIANSTRGNGIMRPDGSVVSITMAYPGSGSDYYLALAQFDADGQPDTAFGNGGLAISSVVVDQGNSTEGGLGASLLPDGRILVSSTTVNVNNGGLLMACFLPDGDLDSSYAVNGVSIVSTNNDYRVGDRHALLPDGSTIQFGHVINGYAPICLERDASGQVVGGFGTNGFVNADFGQPYGTLTGGLMLPSGRIIGYGQFEGADLLAVRLTTDPDADALPVISLDGDHLVTTGSGAMQWYVDGNMISGETANTLVPAQNGDYTVTMTLTDQCTYTSSPFTVLTAGISAHRTSGVRMLGNVVNTSLLLQNDGTPRPFDILDVQGSRMVTGALRAGANTIELPMLANGVYVFRMGGPSVLTLPFIVEH